MPLKRPRAKKITEQQFAAVVHAFMNSPKFLGYSQSTKETWGRELRFMAREDTLGALSVHEIGPPEVAEFFDGLEGLPGKQRSCMGALKQVEKFGIVRRMLPQHITTGVEVPPSSDGHVPWTDDQVALAEQHARPELARVITLAANTGQRRSDLVRMRWTDIETYNGIDGINVTQQKTELRLWVPITEQLAAAMASWERQPGYILRSATGLQWNCHTLTLAWAHERDHNPALAPLAGCVLHGLRGTACVRRIRAGFNTRQVSDAVGMSEPMVARYTRFSSQRENASAAVLNFDRTFRERKPDVAKKTQG